MSGSDEGSGTPDPDHNVGFWPEDDEEIEVDYMHLGSEDSGGKTGHEKSRQGTSLLKMACSSKQHFATPTIGQCSKLKCSLPCLVYETVVNEEPIGFVA
jgi:hypothetical protein